MQEKVIGRKCLFLSSNTFITWLVYQKNPVDIALNLKPLSSIKKKLNCILTYIFLNVLSWILAMATFIRLVTSRTRLNIVTLLAIVIIGSTVSKGINVVLESRKDKLYCLTKIINSFIQLSSNKHISGDGFLNYVR